MLFSKSIFRSCVPEIDLQTRGAHTMRFSEKPRWVNFWKAFAFASIDTCKFKHKSGHLSISLFLLQRNVTNQRQIHSRWTIISQHTRYAINGCSPIGLPTFYFFALTLFQMERQFSWKSAKNIVRSSRGAWPLFSPLYPISVAFAGSHMLHTYVNSGNIPVWVFDTVNVSIRWMEHITIASNDGVHCSHCWRLANGMKNPLFYHFHFRSHYSNFAHTKIRNQKSAVKKTDGKHLVHISQCFRLDGYTYYYMTPPTLAAVRRIWKLTRSSVQQWVWQTRVSS